MKHKYGVMALVAAFGVIGCGGSVDDDSSSGTGGTGGAATGGSGGASTGGGGSGGTPTGGGGSGGSPSGGSGGSGGVTTTCTGLSEAECQAKPGCRADHCACPGVVGYVGCTSVDSPPTPCPGSCPLFPCTALGTAEACEARVDCHSVYMPGACGCAACCCTIFDHCADGGTANCKGPASCDVPAPDCANQYCNGMYALAYTGTCYEGCVLTKQCAAP